MHKKARDSEPFINALTYRLEMFSAVFSHAVRRGVHAFFAFFPLRRADIAVLFVELQRVDHTQHFVDVTTQRQIVYDGGEQYR